MKKVWRILIIIVVAALLSPVVIYLASALTLFAVSHFTDMSTGEPEESASEWMGEIPDSEPLSLISIPGTHDSTTKNTPLHYCYQCQDTTITEQLEMGYRFFDIRLVLIQDDDGNDVLIFMHGNGHCRNEDGSYMTFTDLENQCMAFLDAHPTECIILMMDTEESRSGHASSVSAVMQKQIAETSSFWYTENRIPELGEVRGKMVLATRFGDVNGVGEDKCGWALCWSDEGSDDKPASGITEFGMNETESFYVQDWYSLTTDDKWSVFSEALNADVEDEHTLMLNLLSTSRAYLFLPCPKMRAKALNKKFLSLNLESGRCYGIVIVDFASSDLARQIYETNFE